MNCSIRNILALAITTITINTGNAQPVAQNVLVEHFTNSYCSVCASRNPGFYQNLFQFPQVLHISYYPSSPYPACPLNQYNKPEADARTNFYGVYGSTPRLVIQGAVIPSQTNYGNSSLFQSVSGKTTSFAATLSLSTINATTGQARIVVSKKDTASIDSLSLYIAIVEDTLFFNANNGEQKHYDVFRRSVLGQNPLRVLAPVNVGDSIVHTATFAIDAQWPLQRMYAIGIVQQKSGTVIQAAKSNKLQTSTTGIENLSVQQFQAYPNPAHDIIRIDNAAGATLRISDMSGRILQTIIVANDENVSVRELPAGTYIFSITNAAATSNLLITKE